MANFTAREQLMLELINRARMDPSGEAARYGISLNEGLSSGTISKSAKQVLAGNDKLGLAADKHSSWMLTNDKFAHNESPSSSPGYYGYTPADRIAKAGYSYSSWGENLAWVGTSGSINRTQSILDLHRNLFVDAGVSGRGHRLNILEADFKEIGVGSKYGTYKQGSFTYDASMMTTDFGARSGITFVTGVIYDDDVKNDNFFSVGEEVADRSVSGSGKSDTTGTGGGYELAFTSTGTKTITFDVVGDNLKVSFSLGSKNVKIDAVNRDEIWTNVSLTSESTAIKQLHALGVSKMNLTGSSASEKIYGNKADNVLKGKGGNDSISAGGGDDTITGGTGADSMSGSSGDDEFVFTSASHSTVAAPDTIKGFDDSGNDTIVLSSLYSGTLSYKDEAAITGANQVNVTKSGTSVIVHINLDADLTDEMRIILTDTTLGSMTKGDFIL